jgi:hypothetical protein
MHKVFISYHHQNDQYYRDCLVEAGEQYSIFIDASVDTGDISDHLSDQAIRETIRDEYLRDSTVTIVLVGSETRRRKHVDWEIYSSMHDGRVNKKSGILVINLPGMSDLGHTAHDGEKQAVYPDVTSWTTFDTRREFEDRYPEMPDRIVDNLIEPKARISVLPWSRVDVDTLRFLIDATFSARTSCQYDLSRPLRRANS